MHAESAFVAFRDCGHVVLVCVFVREGCVSILTGRVIFGGLFWVKQVWEVF